MFRLALTLTCLAKLIAIGTPCFIGRSLNNGCTWMSISLIHVALTILRTVHALVHIPANLIYQHPLIRLITFWPKFYWSLFSPKSNRRSIWNIICDPVPDSGTKTKNISTRMVCLRDRYSCHSFYQVQGVYAHLHQSSEKDLDEAIQTATAIIYYDDPLRLAIPYEYLLEWLPEPPDGITKSLLSLTIIISIYSMIVIKGLQLFY